MAYYKLPAKYSRMVADTSDEGSEVFYYLKPGWARFDGVHHVAYETAHHSLADVIADFKTVKQCSCAECVELHQQI